VKPAPALFAIALTRCAAPSGPEEAELLPDRRLAPPIAVQLHVEPAVLLIGSPFTVRVTGQPAGTRMTLLASEDVGAPGLCPPAIAPLCAEIAAPYTGLGRRTTAADGTATWTFQAPATLPARVELQAWGARAGSIYLSEALTVPTLAPAGDDDADGLSNATEVADGLDPLDPDMDDDGLDDGTEIASGSDPLDRDSDGGCIDDGAEHAAGTDARDPQDDLGDAASPESTDVSGQTTWFARGASLPAGDYTVTYVDGCMKFNAAHAWSVHAYADGRAAWWLVGATPDLFQQMAPGTVGFRPDEGGFAVFSDCVNANLGLALTIGDFPGGPLGLWLTDYEDPEDHLADYQDNPPSYGDNIAGEGGRNPRWRLDRVGACP
jgi:hypothetical protein